MPKNNDIGYGKPPRSSQWKPGQSGNPGGRPKASCDLFSGAAAILTQPVRVKSRNGRVNFVDALELGFLKLCREALRGNRPALNKALELILEFLPPALQTQTRSQNEGEDAKMKLAKIMGLKIDENGNAIADPAAYEDEDED